MPRYRGWIGVNIQPIYLKKWSNKKDLQAYKIQPYGPDKSNSLSVYYVDIFDFLWAWKETKQPRKQPYLQSIIEHSIFESHVWLFES